MRHGTLDILLVPSLSSQTASQHPERVRLASRYKSCTAAGMSTDGGGPSQASSLVVGSLLDVELEFLAGKRWRQLGTLQHGLELCLQIQRLGGGGGQFVRALLQRRHHVGMLIGDIVLLGRVLRDVVELH